MRRPSNVATAYGIRRSAVEEQDAAQPICETKSDTQEKNFESESACQVHREKGGFSLRSRHPEHGPTRRRRVAEEFEIGSGANPLDEDMDLAGQFARWYRIMIKVVRHYLDPKTLRQPGAGAPGKCAEVLCCESDRCGSWVLGDLSCRGPFPPARSALSESR